MILPSGLLGFIRPACISWTCRKRTDLSQLYHYPRQPPQWKPHFFQPTNQPTNPQFTNQTNKISPKNSAPKPLLWLKTPKLLLLGKNIFRHPLNTLKNNQLLNLPKQPETQHFSDQAPGHRWRGQVSSTGGQNFRTTTVQRWFDDGCLLRFKKNCLNQVGRGLENSCDLCLVQMGLTYPGIEKNDGNWLQMVSLFPHL